MKCKKAKRIDDHSKIMYEEWEFCSVDCLVRSIAEEAKVCGDEIRQPAKGTLVIFNHHKGSVRWKGVI